MHHSYQDTVACEDTRNELLASYTNTTKIKERHCVDLKYSKVNTKHKKNESFLEIVLKAVGIKNDEELPTTKEISTLVLLGIMLVLLIISATGFIVMWFTEYYNNSMLEKLILSENSETAKDWIDPNPKYDTLLKIHIFNYTNINEFLSGKEDKIRVQDVGPLTYKEHTKKVQVVFNKNHTVTFRDHRNYTFLPEKSVCGEHDLFILPNVPLLSASIKIEKLNPLKKAIATNVIRFMKQDVFKTLSAHEFLWGYRDKIVGLDIGTGSNYFGLLRNRNGTSVDSLQINTGEDYIGKYSIITQFNGMPLLDFWSDEECNRIDGSDASMFPPTLLENFEQLNVFLSVLCRKIPLNFEKKVKILGNIDAFRYRTPLNVFAHPDINPENQCYCHNTQTCLPSGVINATKCYDGAPIYPSFPHFFSGDPAIYKSFEGIAPSAELHQTYADIHPRFAFPISGASRIQINVPIHKSDIVRTKIEEGTILPLIWIEITTGDFTDDIIDKLYVSTFGLDAIQYALKYGTLLVSVTTFGLILAICFYLQRRKEELSLSKDIQGEIRPHTSMKTTETNEQAEPRNENFGD